MTSGDEHEQATQAWVIPITMAISIIFDIKSAALAGISFVIGGLFLSPDLDTISKPLARWGLLKIIWYPYRKCIKHRSCISHGLIIGTLGRVLYLFGIYLIIFSFTNNFELERLEALIKDAKILIIRYPDEIVSILLGLEISAWLHLLLDGDPIPKDWNIFKSR